MESWLRYVTCWNNFVGIATHSEGHRWDMAKSKRKSEFHPWGIFQQESCWGKEVISNVNFALSSNSKDQLGDLNQKL